MEILKCIIFNRVPDQWPQIPAVLVVEQLSRRKILPAQSPVPRRCRASLSELVTVMSRLIAKTFAFGLWEIYSHSQRRLPVSGTIADHSTACAVCRAGILYLLGCVHTIDFSQGTTDAHSLQTLSIKIFRRACKTCLHLLKATRGQQNAAFPSGGDTPA